mgnify:CR=1 FL=1
MSPTSPETVIFFVYGKIQTSMSLILLDISLKGTWLFTIRFLPKKDDFIFTNRSTGKPFSKRMWSTNLNEMLVESGLATWRPRDDAHATRQIDVKSGKKFSWYSFRHTFITFALNRGVPITTVCNNCDTGIKYVQDHYFHFDARGKETQGALMVGRKYSPKQSLNPDWMKDNLIGFSM